MPVSISTQVWGPTAAPMTIPRNTVETQATGPLIDPPDSKAANHEVYMVSIWLFPKFRGPILVAFAIRTLIYLGLFGGPLFMEAPI